MKKYILLIIGLIWCLNACGNQEDKKASYIYSKVSYKNDKLPTNTVKGSQFSQALFEFNGACPGCGETPYLKVISQMFGDRMMVANATGCSSIYSGSAPSTPYTTNKNGEGPSWGSSLFEDNAEYGFGMHIGVEALRARIQHTMEENMDKVDEDVDIETIRKEARIQLIKYLRDEAFEEKEVRNYKVATIIDRINGVRDVDRILLNDREQSIELSNTMLPKLTEVTINVAR